MAIAFTEGITEEDWERERISLPLHRAVAAFDDGARSRSRARTRST